MDPGDDRESALAGRHSVAGQVFTRSTPPRRRVADQQAGACRWCSWP